jgi:hypothetical protein
MTQSNAVPIMAARPSGVCTQGRTCHGGSWRTCWLWPTLEIGHPMALAIFMKADNRSPHAAPGEIRQSSASVVKL